MRPGWKKVRFGDVVKLSGQRSANPGEDGFRRFVGLEHIDPGDLAVRRWGDTADGTTFTTVFRPGQVLFGKRRAYQRKVAVPDFDGVCSSDIYVLVPKSAALLPALLPFICQTDGFFRHAVGTSAGSLSPRTNWDSLAAYEFDLPPLDAQRRISELLSAAISLARQHDEAAFRAGTVSEALLSQDLRGAYLGGLAYDKRFGHYSRRLPLTPLGEALLATQYGLSEPGAVDGRFPMLRMMDLSDGLATDDDLCSVDLSTEDFARYRLEIGDVLFNRTNSHGLVGRTGVYRLVGNHVFASYLVRLRVDPKLLVPEYLCAFLNAPLGRRQVMRYATRGVSQTNVNVANLRNVLIPLPSVDYQKTVVKRRESLRRARGSHLARAQDARRLAARIANEYLGEAG
jgi:type I restriction enzyme S subunit